MGRRWTSHHDGHERSGQRRRLVQKWCKTPRMRTNSSESGRTMPVNFLDRTDIGGRRRMTLREFLNRVSSVRVRLGAPLVFPVCKPKTGYATPAVRASSSRGFQPGTRFQTGLSGSTAVISSSASLSLISEERSAKKCFTTRSVIFFRRRFGPVVPSRQEMPCPSK
jgi:hypothetical protein